MKEIGRGQKSDGWRYNPITIHQRPATRMKKRGQKTEEGGIISSDNLLQTALRGPSGTRTRPFSSDLFPLAKPDKTAPSELGSSSEQEFGHGVTGPCDPVVHNQMITMCLFGSQFVVPGFRACPCWRFYFPGFFLPSLVFFSFSRAISSISWFRASTSSPLRPRRPSFLSFAPFLRYS